jgi:SAM-dependent methyltransferase
MRRQVPPGHGSRACEICGGTLDPLRLGPADVLDRCRECGHVHRDLTACPAGHRDFAYGGDPGLDRARLALTHRALVAGGPPRSVFEIGYGSGALLRRFVDRGAEVGGVDPDQLGVEVDPVVRAVGRLWAGSVESLPDGWFEADLVVAVHVLEHVEDPVSTLRRASALLAPGGRVVVVTPAGDSWGLRAHGSAWWMLEDPTHVRFFTSASLRRAAESAGLRPVAVDRLVVDSLSTDAASMARRFGVGGPGGALAHRSVLGAAVATAPVVLGVRALAPRTRSTLRLVAERA